MLTDLIWKEKKVIVNDLDFWLQVHLKEDIRSKHNGFVFYKDKKLIDMYKAFFSSITSSSKEISNVMEIGMWDGGSAVFWHEILKPSKLVGIDLLETGGTESFIEYKKQNSKTFADFWGVSQTDKTRLKTIIENDFNGEEIDLVFDDASHRYHQSLESFNIVFPYVKKGGYYIIEDWAWGHWKHEDSSSYPPYTEPTRLIFELVEAAANVGLIENIHLCSGFTAIKRGSLDISKDTFNLHDYIYRRPVTLKNRFKKTVKKFLGKQW